MFGLDNVVAILITIVAIVVVVKFIKGCVKSLLITVAVISCLGYLFLSGKLSGITESIAVINTFSYLQ